MKKLIFPQFNDALPLISNVYASRLHVNMELSSILELFYSLGLKTGNRLRNVFEPSLQSASSSRFRAAMGKHMLRLEIGIITAFILCISIFISKIIEQNTQVS